MTTFTTLLALALVATAAAAPHSGGVSQILKCATECNIAANKFAYEVNKVYTYEYSGSGNIELEGAQGGQPNPPLWNWKTKVEFKWLNPCDVVLKIREPHSDAKDLDRMASQYPMLVAMSDGRVNHVCAHPNETPFVINIKKGIVSQLQNSIPAKFNYREPLNITETDIIGRCDTQYSVEGQGSQIKVTKEKNHKHCHERYHLQSEVHSPEFGLPYPLQESWSKCTQDIENGVYKKVECVDRNVVKAMIGSYKFVNVEKKAKFEYLSVSEGGQLEVGPFEGYRVQSLRFDFEENRKQQSLVPVVEQEIESICETTKEQVKPETASKVAEVITLMRAIPHDSIPQIVQKIRSKQLCAQNPKMENMIMDLIAEVKEAGAVRVMVDELASGRASYAHQVLYTLGLYNTPRPDIHAITALKPLFESEQTPGMAKLAGGSMIKLFCRHAPTCYENQNVLSVVQALTSRVQRLCVPSGVTPHPALADLKALGNTGVVTKEMAQTVLTCMEAEIPEISVRVSAAQALRQSRCYPEVTQRLVNYVVNPVKDTEVRISAYLAAIRCARHEDLRKIVDGLAGQPNTQVRGFVFSHLMNLQQSDALQKQSLRYNLTDIVVPDNFRADIRKYSRNLDLSYWAPSLGLGAGLETNLVFAPGSFVPRSVDFNVTTEIDRISLNPVELGARFEGLESFFAHIFGPDSYFSKTSYEKVFKDLLKFVQENIEVIKEEFENVRQRRSINMGMIKDLLKRMWDELPTDVQADVYARLWGREVVYGQLKGDLKNLNVQELIRRAVEFVTRELGDIKLNDIDTARVMAYEEKVFISTIHGIPLEIKLNTTAVAGLKLKTDMIYPPQWPQGQKRFDFQPSLSIQTDTFIGFSGDIVRIGLKMNNTVSMALGSDLKVNPKSGTELEVELDLPERMDLVEVKSEAFFMMKEWNQPARRFPQSVSDPRTPIKSCVGGGLSEIIGLEFCYDIDYPDWTRSQSIPLTSRPAVVKFQVRRTEADLTGYKSDLTYKQEGTKKILQGKLVTKGSSAPKESDLTLTYDKQAETNKAEIKLSSQSYTGVIDAALVNQEMHKSLAVTTESKSSQGSIVKSVKVDFKNMSSGSSKEYDLGVYASNQREVSAQDVMFAGKMKKVISGDNIDVEIIGKTQNALRNYIIYDYVLEGSAKYMTQYRIPVPTNLKKFEFNAGVPQLKIESCIEQSSGSSQYQSEFKLVQGGQESLKAEATVNLQGYLGRDFVATASFNGKLGQKSYKGHESIEISRNKYGVALQLLDESDSCKIIDMETAVTFASPQSAVFKIETQLISNGVKIELKAAEQGPSQYHVKSDFTKGGQTLLSIQGPLTIMVKPHDTKLELDLNINSRKQVSAKYIMQSDKQQVLFKFDSQSHNIIVVEYDMKSTSGEHGSEGSGKLFVDAVIDATLQGRVTANRVHFSTKTHLMPTQGGRQIKAFADLNLDSKQIQSQVTWDSEHQRENKLNVQSQVISFSTQPPRAVIQSEIAYNQQTYNIKVDLQPRTLMTQYDGQGVFEVDVTTPQQKHHKVKSDVQLHIRQNSIKLMTDNDYKSPESREYKIYTETMVEKSSGMLKYETVMKYHNAEGQQKSWTVVYDHTERERDCGITFKSQMSSPTLSHPLEVVYQYNRQQHTSYRAKITSQQAQPATLLNTDFEFVPSGGIKNLDISIDMRAIESVVRQIVQLVQAQRAQVLAWGGQPGAQSGGQYEMRDMQSGGQTDSRLMQPVNYRVKYQTPEAGHHTMLIQSHARHIEARSKMSPSEYTLEVYPNRRMSEQKFGVTGRKSQGLMGTNYEVRMNHPSMNKELVGFVELMDTGSSLEGKFELDVLPDTADKVTGTLHSNFVARDTVRVEVELESRVLPSKPKVIMEASSTHNLTSIDFRVHKSPSSPEAFKLQAKLINQTRHELGLSLQIVHDQTQVINFAGKVKSQEKPRCNGLQFDAMVRTNSLNNMDMHADLCRPAFIALRTKRPGASQVYRTTFGIQLPHRAEWSVMRMDRFELQREPVEVFGVELVSPTALKFKYGGDAQEASQTKDFVVSEIKHLYRNVKEFALNIYEQIKQEAQSKNIPFPNPELNKLWNDVLQELAQIYSEFKADVYDPVIYNARQILSPIAELISSQCNACIVHCMKFVREHYSHSIVEVIEQVRRDLPVLTRKTQEVVVQTAQWVKSGQEPQVLNELINQIKSTTIAQWVNEYVLAKLQSAFPQRYEAAQQVFEKVKSAVWRDVEKLQVYLRNKRVVEAIADQVIHVAGNEQETNKILAQSAVEQLVYMSTGLALEGSDRVTSWTLSLYRPLFSLSQVAQKAVQSPSEMVMGVLSVNRIPEMYYRWLPVRQMWAPFNGTAMVLNATEIMTFDGAVIHAVPSKCEVVMAKVKSAQVAQLTMQSPQQERPQFDLKVADATASIGADYSVKINGRPVTQNTEIPPFNVQLNQHVIEIGSPVMSLRVIKEAHVTMVNVSRWTYNHTEGLLGRYDNEVSNDFLMPNGQNATSMTELFKSWQVNPSCVTQTMQREEPQPWRIVVCQILFFMQRACHPVIDPTPYLQQCYTAEQACTPAMAYREACVQENVHFPYRLPC